VAAIASLHLLHGGRFHLLRIAQHIGHGGGGDTGQAGDFTQGGHGAATWCELASIDTFFES
jgi:hypothetical protein